MTNMITSRRAANAYRAAIAHRSLRQQEADVFRHATGGLRLALGRDRLAVARAIADNRRLWHAVMDALRDPGNQLPDTMRAALLSIGHAVQKEMRAPEPDIAFLIDVNENIAAGLAL